MRVSSWRAARTLNRLEQHFEFFCEWPMLITGDNSPWRSRIAVHRGPIRYLPEAGAGVMWWRTGEFETVVIGRHPG
jgi:hypothetical protein